MESHQVPHYTSTTRSNSRAQCSQLCRLTTPCNCYAVPRLQQRAYPAVMQSLEGCCASQAVPVRCQYKTPQRRAHQPFDLSMEQTSTIVNTPTNAAKMPSMSFETYPNRQDLPALGSDKGGSSDSSFFEPTTFPTPQDDEDTHKLGLSNEVGPFEQHIDSLIAFDGAWNSEQGPRRYRALAPKPPTPRPEQLPPNDEQQRRSSTAPTSVGQFPPATRNISLPLRGACFDSQVLPLHASLNTSNRDLLLQSPASPTPDMFLTSKNPAQTCHDFAGANSSHFLHNQTLSAGLHPKDFTQLHRGAGLVTIENGQSRFPLPAGPSSGAGSDFDAMFSITASDNFPFRLDEHSRLDTPAAVTPSIESPAGNIMQQQTSQPPDPFWTGIDPNLLPNDFAMGTMPAKTDDIEQYNLRPASSMPPPPGYSVAQEEVANNANHFNLPSVHLANEVGVYSLPSSPDMSLDDGVSSRPSLQSDVALPMTPYRNHHEASFPPLEDSLESQYTGYYPHNSDNSDNFDFSSSPFYSAAARNPSLPTTPHRTDERGNRDTTKDKLLIEAREKGLSYKDIKDMYGFTEAESTLRGRWRTLTKPKEERVRKPVWDNKAVGLYLPPSFLPLPLHLRCFTITLADESKNRSMSSSPPCTRSPRPTTRPTTSFGSAVKPSSKTQRTSRRSRGRKSRSSSSWRAVICMATRQPRISIRRLGSWLWRGWRCSEVG